MAAFARGPRAIRKLKNPGTEGEGSCRSRKAERGFDLAPKKGG